jgi:hypothetical protein
MAVLVVLVVLVVVVGEARTRRGVSTSAQVLTDGSREGTLAALELHQATSNGVSRSAASSPSCLLWLPWRGGPRAPRAPRAPNRRRSQSTGSRVEVSSSHRSPTAAPTLALGENTSIPSISLPPLPALLRTALRYTLQPLKLKPRWLANLQSYPTRSNHKFFDIHFGTATALSDTDLHPSPTAVSCQLSAVFNNNNNNNLAN